jgi:hypothetical protein
MAMDFIGRLRSYNLDVSPRLLLTIGLAAVVLAPRPAAQQPPLPEVLQRAAAYVKRFHSQLAGIVAEETYQQVVHRTSEYQSPVLDNAVRVSLRSDLMLVRPANVDRYVEFRDVLEVNGIAVREPQQRVESLWRAGSTAAAARLGDILEQSSRYNIGSIERNINTPLMALMFLDASSQRRFVFKRADQRRPVFGSGAHAGENAGVFRVATEMWDVEFEEKRGATIIRRPDGGNLRSRGRFWIDPATGAVLISELVVDGGGVLARVTVSYQSEPLMGFLVPVEMRESYERRHEVITGHAVYGRFRLIEQ